MAFETSIRSATSNDADLLIQLIKDLARFEKAEESVRISAQHLRAQMQLSNPPFECVIAECDGRAAGFALYYYAFSTWEGRTLYLEDLFVAQEFRGTGAGAKLMKHLASIAEQNGCARFEWSVLNWNASAIGFYDRIGAKPVPGWTRYRIDPTLMVG